MTVAGVANTFYACSLTSLTSLFKNNVPKQTAIFIKEIVDFFMRLK